VRVDEHTITSEYGPVHYRSAPAADPSPLYLHDVPTSSEDWVPFLERTGGLAPDLIGFGRSAKGGHLDYSPEGLTAFVERFLRQLKVEHVALVGHGWGAAVAVLLAGRDPARITRLVLIDAVPLLAGFRWCRLARLWRRPVIGELVMGVTTKSMLARELRKGTVREDAWSRARVESVWDQFDQGTQRALLRLHRAADEDRLAALGSKLGPIDRPTLIVWGERDPWFGPEFADAYGAQLGDATVRRLPDTGHWPWLDRPDVVELVGDFLARP
jgi:pimeloyl-ACP methyl ester carboxylesterase